MGRGRAFLLLCSLSPLTGRGLSTRAASLRAKVPFREAQTRGEALTRNLHEERKFRPLHSPSKMDVNALARGRGKAARPSLNLAPSELVPAASIIFTPIP